MKVIIPVDDRMGMTFNNRRQSRDTALTEWILFYTQNDNLWMNSYSAKLFPEDAGNLQISETFMDHALSSDFCFVENIDPQLYETKIEEIILCKWNRVYPGDMHFTIDLSTWTYTETLEISGNSHDKITIERYLRGRSQ